jgi:hypothetical protein
MPTESAKDAILEAQVNAALSGHDIGPFEPVDTYLCINSSDTKPLIPPAVTS